MKLDRMTQTVRFPARREKFAANDRSVADGTDIGTFKDSLRAPSTAGLSIRLDTLVTLPKVLSDAN